jgi:hypothetical protein
MRWKTGKKVVGVQEVLAAPPPQHQMSCVN